MHRLGAAGFDAGHRRLPPADHEPAGAYRWKIATPLRAYGGDADEAIPPAVSRMVVDFNRLLGGTQVEFFSAGERADHRASYVAATLAVKPWFDGFVKPAAGISR